VLFLTFVTVESGLLTASASAVGRVLSDAGSAMLLCWNVLSTLVTVRVLWPVAHALVERRHAWRHREPRDYREAEEERQAFLVWLAAVADPITAESVRCKLMDRPGVPGEVEGEGHESACGRWP
jgi:hypothetical protein